MFNQNRVLDMDDFLEAIGFVVPEGYNLEYFVVPREAGINLPSNSGIRVEDRPEDETITYHMTPPNQKHDTAENPAEYSIWEPPKLGRRLPTPHPPILSTDPSELKSPFVQMIKESRSDRLTFRLKEGVYPFSEGTLFSCRRKRI